jgi:aminoacrylate hydrolase
LLADDLLKLMDAIGIDRASLIGHSTGGAIGQIIAAQDPARVDQLVLYASWGGPCRQLMQCMAIRQQALMWGGPSAYHRASTVFLYPPRYICESWGVLSEEVSAGERNSTSQSILNARIEAILAFDGTRYLGDIKAPTTVLVAADDILTPPLASEALTEGIRGARMKMLPYGGHAVSRVEPANFNRTVIESLSA